MNDNDEDPAVVKQWVDDAESEALWQRAGCAVMVVSGVIAVWGLYHLGNWIIEMLGHMS